MYFLSQLIWFDGMINIYKNPNYEKSMKNRYNVIAKMESFAVDTQFILEEGGLDDELQVEWKHHTGIQIIYCPPF